MGKRSTSKHAASARAAARLRRLLVAVVCGGLVFVLGGLLLGSATTATRLLLASEATVVVYAGLLLAKIGRAKGGRRRAAAVADPDASFADGEIGIFGVGEDIETVDDAEDGERGELLPAEAEHAHEESMDPAAEAEAPAVPALLLEELMRQAMAEELANAAAQEDSEEVLAEVTPTLAAEQDEAQSADAGVVVPDVVTHDLVPISSLHEARAEGEAQSLQRIRATVRGIGVRTGDDPVAVDVLARVVAAVDRLMVSDASFQRPALSETGPLLAAASAPQEAAPPAREAMPLPAVPAMRPSDMPVTELSATQLPPAAVPDEPPGPAPTPQTQPIEAVVVDDAELVLPIPAPPKPQPAPRGRRLRRSSVA